MQPGEEEYSAARQHSPTHSLPPSTWRTSPGNSPLDAEMTDHMRGMHGPGSSANVSPTPDLTSVATKRKLSLRKSLISMSPFHAPSSSNINTSATSPKHSPPSSLSNTTNPMNSTANGNSEPSSPWGMGHPFPTQHPHTQQSHGSSNVNNFSLGKRRNKSVNSEASVLRGQIAAKEYEVQRITKDLERRREKDKRQELLTHPSSGIISRVSDPKPKTNEAAAQLYQHSQELAKVPLFTLLLLNAAAVSVFTRHIGQGNRLADYLFTLLLSRVIERIRFQYSSILYLQCSSPSCCLPCQHITSPYDTHPDLLPPPSLSQLKALYLGLTGSPYEQSSRGKGPLSRLRVFGGGSSAAASEVLDTPAISGTSSSNTSAAGSTWASRGSVDGVEGGRSVPFNPAVTVVNVHVPKGPCRFPAHWQPTP